MHTPKTLHAMPSPRNSSGARFTLYGPEPIGAAGAIPLADVFNEDTAARLAACWNYCDGMPLHDLERGNVGALVEAVREIERKAGQARDDALTARAADLESVLRDVIEDLETNQDWQCALRRANGVFEGPVRQATSSGYTWRLAPHGSAWVLSNAEHADIGNAYLVPSGKWVGSPWGREIRHFEGPSAETDAKTWVEHSFR